jgi:hypothetical protein
VIGESRERPAAGSSKRDGKSPATHSPTTGSCGPSSAQPKADVERTLSTIEGVAPKEPLFACGSTRHAGSAKCARTRDSHEHTIGAESPQSRAGRDCALRGDSMYSADRVKPAVRRPAMLSAPRSYPFCKKVLSADLTCRIELGTVPGRTSTKLLRVSNGAPWEEGEDLERGDLERGDLETGRARTPQ